MGLRLFLAASFALLAPTFAEEPPPEGIPVGDVILAPWLETDFLVDDNIFRRSEDNIALPPESDFVTTARVGLTAFIPIRMSQLRLGYEGYRFFYQDNDRFNGNSSQVGSVEFDANFSTRDKLLVATSLTRGVTELQNVENGEPVGLGFSFDQLDWSVEWQHQAYQRPSFRTRIANTDQEYDVAANVAWFNRSGWEVENEWAQPIYRRGYLTAKYSGRRQRHESVENGGLLKRELYDGAEFGFRGTIGRNQSFSAALGYGRLDFRDGIWGSLPATFSGLVGDIRWRLPVGGATAFDLSLTRRPIASYFNTHYVNSQLRLNFSRRALQSARYGVALTVGRADYADELTDPNSGNPALNCLGIIRVDDRTQVEAYWEWFVHSRAALRLRGNHNRFDSNCDLASYDSSGVGMLVRVGWF